LRDLELSSNGLKNGTVLLSNVLEVSFFELFNVRGGNVIKIASNTSVEDTYLLLRWHRDVLLLVHKLSKLFTSQEKLLGGGIEIGTELGESLYLSELGKIELDRTRHLLHGLDLSSGSDTGYRKTNVNGRSLTLME
jgi:hypothetical protein